VLCHLDGRVAGRAAWAGQPPIDGPVHIGIGFVLPRPTGARKSAIWQAKKPDIDKLIRATLDGLTEAGVVVDDARVASLTASKQLSDPADPWTGATIDITPLEADDRVPQECGDYPTGKPPRPQPENDTGVWERPR
jgi:hypothetical protein